MQDPLTHNPSLREEPRFEPAGVIAMERESSLLDWLERNNRLLNRDPDDDFTEVDEEEEISELMGADDNSYDEDEVEEFEEE